jgi:hypothetical protein
MGTSSSYKGPKGVNPLLPPWADPPPDVPATGDDGTPPADDGVAPESAPAPPSRPTVSWRGPKQALSRLAHSGGGGGGAGGGSYRSTMRSYVRARHGAVTAARSAVAGRTATARLGGFLAQGIRDGFAAVARRFGIDHLGRGVQFVLAAFVDLLAPDGAQLDEAAARKAVIDTITELFEQYDVAGNGIEALDHLTAEGMREAITLSIANVIDEKFQQDLASRVEDGRMSERAANELMEHAGDFIRGIVEIDTGAVDILSLDWDSTEGRDLVQQMYETAYSLLENAT